MPQASLSKVAQGDGAVKRLLCDQVSIYDCTLSKLRYWRLYNKLSDQLKDDAADVYRRLYVSFELVYHWLS